LAREAFRRGSARRSAGEGEAVPVRLRQRRPLRPAGEGATPLRVSLGELDHPAPTPRSTFLPVLTRRRIEAAERSGLPGACSVTQASASPSRSHTLRAGFCRSRLPGRELPGRVPEDRAGAQGYALGQQKGPYSFRLSFRMAQGLERGASCRAPYGFRRRLPEFSLALSRQLHQDAAP
jgi:hypothetical protein